MSETIVSHNYHFAKIGDDTKQVDVYFYSTGKIKTFGGWYQHYYITIDGKSLLGSLQTKRAHKRTECITIFGDGCIIGHDWRWLAKQNGYTILD